MVSSFGFAPRIAQLRGAIFFPPLRFVGRYLIYGTGSAWGYPKENVAKWNLFLVDWARGNSHQLKLTHDVDRIEQMGSDAVIVGTNGNDLQFSAVRLESCEG